MRVLWRAARWLLLGLALLVALLILPFLLDQAEETMRRLLGANVLFLLVAAAGVVVWILAFGALIRESAAAVGRHLPGGRTSLLASALQFVYAFPAGTVAGLVYETRTVEKMGVPRGTAMLIVGLETVVFYGTFLIFLLTGLIVLALSREAGGGLILGAGLLMATIAGVALAALYVLGDPVRAMSFHALLGRWFGHGGGVARSVDEIALAVQRIRHDPGVLAKPLVAALAHWTAVLVVLELVFLSLGSRAHPAVVVTGFSVAFFVSRLTPIPGGLGAFEGAMVATFTALDVGFETALTVTLGFRFLTFLLPVAAGVAAHHVLVRYAAPELETVVPVVRRGRGQG